MNTAKGKKNIIIGTRQPWNRTQTIKTPANNNITINIIQHGDRDIETTDRRLKKQLNNQHKTTPGTEDKDIDTRQQCHKTRRH